MQIILRNGGKTSEFECKFKETEIIYYPNGKVEYKLSKDDVNSHFRCCADLEYQEKYKNVDAKLLEYYLHFENSKPHLIVRNKNDDTSIQRGLIITLSEMEIIEKITNRMFG